MELIIHRGSRQIGGSMVEVRQGGTRILLDLGLPLPEPGAVRRETEAMPPAIAGLWQEEAGSPQVDAVFLSHAHLDHSGHLPQLRPDIPVYATAGTWALLEASAAFGILGTLPGHRKLLVPERPVRVGELLVTPFATDHSAPDAVTLLVEGGGQSLIYSGDIRRHGRNAECFPGLLRKLPRGADALLLEGTQVGAESAEGQPCSEEELERPFRELFKATKGLPLVFSSGQNLDRTLTVYRAAAASGRVLVMDLYTAWIQHRLRRLSPDSPQHDQPDVRIKYWPHHQRVLFAQDPRFLGQVAASHIGLEELVSHEDRFVLLARSNRQLHKLLAAFPDPARCRFIWSMWEGYLTADNEVQRLSTERGVPLDHCHTSGHAPVADLQELVAVLRPRRVIPIHTEHPEAYAGLFPDVLQLEDGELLDLEAPVTQTKELQHA